MRRREAIAAGMAAFLINGVGRARAQGGSWADGLFNEHGIDFGAVPRGAKVRHNFVLTNRLNEPVNILDVRASCGCTTGRANATTVPPGGTALLEAEMDTRNFVGVKATTLSVTLLTASGSQATARFGIQSTILPDIVLNPGSADFGTVTRGQSPEQVITIERLGRPDWRFTRLVASDAMCRIVTASLNETYRSASGVGYNLKIQLKADAPPGLLRDELRLLTNDPESPSVPVLVTAQVQGTLTATPAVLALGAAGNSPMKGRFLIRSTRPFAVTAIEGNGDGFTLAAADATPRALQVLTLTFTPQESPTRGDLRRAFRVRTNLPDEAPVDLTATVRLAS